MATLLAALAAGPVAHGEVWGGATSMGFPGQRMPIVFRLSSDGRSITDLTYAGLMGCSGIPESVNVVGGRGRETIPVTGDGAFELHAPRQYPRGNDTSANTVLDLAGRLGTGRATGTLAENAPGAVSCTTGAQSWYALPGQGGWTSQDLAFVADTSRVRNRIARLWLVWSSPCVRTEVERRRSRDTFWIDLRNVRVQPRTGIFELRRVFRLRNRHGDVFRVEGHLRGRAVPAGISGAWRARARNVAPLHDGISRTQRQTCSSPRVTFRAAA